MTPDPDYDDEWLEEMQELAEVAQPQIEEWVRNNKPEPEGEDK